MNILRMAFYYLNEKPIIGFASGVGSGVILTIQTFLTDETLLKLVAAVGVWAGCIVALLTLFLKAIQAMRDFYFYIKLKKK